MGTKEKQCENCENSYDNDGSVDDRLLNVCPECAKKIIISSLLARVAEKEEKSRDYF